MSSPLVSVNMVVYNGEKFIAEAIRSILNQTYSNFELIIVNDASTDSTEKIIKSFSDMPTTSTTGELQTPIDLST